MPTDLDQWVGTFRIVPPTLSHLLKRTWVGNRPIQLIHQELA